MLTEAPIGTGAACRGVTAVLGGEAVRCSAGRTTAGALRASDPFAPVRGFLGNVERVRRVEGSPASIDRPERPTAYRKNRAAERAAQGGSDGGCAEALEGCAGSSCG
jgi:hypothetical protein